MSPTTDRLHLWAFAGGCLAVTAGVLLHVPMFWMARNLGFRLAGMAMDDGMLWGMALIAAGVALSGYGLLPRRRAAGARVAVRIVVSAPEDAPLGRGHVGLMVVLTVALVIDVMKPATLGFVVPGMIDEYGVSRRTVAWLPFAALCGTVLGSVLWGWLADVYGRRASILLSAVMFVGTAICGAMPSLGWNVVMCLLMGAAAGGMLPVTYALLAETMPSRHRGWALVLVGGLGAAGGYLAASGCSAWLQPLFGWRSLWLLNLPTGLVLIVLNVFVPESSKFLLALGRIDEAHATLRRFGCTVRAETASEAAAPESGFHQWSLHASVASRLAATTWALSITAIVWGLINFGLLLWLPAYLAERGWSVALSSRLLAASALVALPTVFVAALLYGRWSSKGALTASIALTALGLLGVLWLDLASAGEATGTVALVAILLVGVNGIIAMLLPYAAESYPLRIRGRATGWVAACTKGGGLVAQMLGLLGWVPALGWATLLMLAPVLVALALVWRYCAETRGSDLRELETGRAAVER